MVQCRKNIHIMYILNGMFNVQESLECSLEYWSCNRMRACAKPHLYSMPFTEGSVEYIPGNSPEIVWWCCNPHPDCSIDRTHQCISFVYMIRRDGVSASLWAIYTETVVHVSKGGGVTERSTHFRQYFP